MVPILWMRCFGGYSAGVREHARFGLKTWTVSVLRSTLLNRSVCSARCLRTAEAHVRSSYYSRLHDESADPFVDIPAPSPIRIHNIKGRNIHFKMDNLARLQLNKTAPRSIPEERPIFIHGNKARKLEYLINMNPFPELVLSFGGNHSNSLLALAKIVFAKRRELQRALDEGSDWSQVLSPKLVYFTTRIPRTVRESPEGIYQEALQLGVEFFEISKDDMDVLQAHKESFVPALVVSKLRAALFNYSTVTWVAFGASSLDAEVGLNRLGEELRLYVQSHTRSLSTSGSRENSTTRTKKWKILVESGSGSTAFHLANYFLKWSRTHPAHSDHNYLSRANGSWSKGVMIYSATEVEVIALPCSPRLMNTYAHFDMLSSLEIKNVISTMKIHAFVQKQDGRAEYAVPAFSTTNSPTCLPSQAPPSPRQSTSALRTFPYPYIWSSTGDSSAPNESAASTLPSYLTSSRAFMDALPLRILSPKLARSFARPAHVHLTIWKEIKAATGIPFDLIYAPRAWELIFDLWETCTNNGKKTTDYPAVNPKAERWISTHFAMARSEEAAMFADTSVSHKSIIPFTQSYQYVYAGGGDSSKESALDAHSEIDTEIIFVCSGGEEGNKQMLFRYYQDKVANFNDRSKSKMKRTGGTTNIT